MLIIAPKKKSPFFQVGGLVIIHEKKEPKLVKG
jgi:hypothetical protein